jgi:hypothetical protein
MILNPGTPRQKLQSTRTPSPANGFKFKEKISKMEHLGNSCVCGAENWTLLKVDQKCLEISQIWC